MYCSNIFTAFARVTLEIMSLKGISKIPQRKKNLIFGYIHDMEKQLKLCAIPRLILCKCLLFSRDEDHFNSGKLGSFGWYLLNK